MTAPSMSFLDETAHHYRDTLAHGVRLGLSEQQIKQVIGDSLQRDAACARMTDWHLVCDRLTQTARAVKAFAELVNGEVTSRG